MKNSNTKTKYYYKGVSLKQLCDEHEYNYQRITRKIRNLNDPKLIEKAIEKFIADNPGKRTPRYKIGDLSLKRYCETNDIVYPTVKTYISNIRKDNPELSDNELALLAIDYYKENHESKEKWFYHGERLVDYCKKNNYVYNDMFGYLEKLNVEDPGNISDDEMNLAIYKMNLNYRKKIFKTLKDSKTHNEYTTIMNQLKIDTNCIEELVKLNFSYKQAIYFVWYFSEDKETYTVSLEEVKKIISNKDYDSMEIDKLLGYYYSGIYDTRYLIYKKMFKPSRKLVVLLCNENNVNLGSELHNSMKEEADVLIFEAIEITSSRYLGQIISYFMSYIKGGLKHYLMYELKEKNDSLNAPKYRDSNKTRNIREKIDYISNDISLNSDTEYFSEEMLEIISNLSDIEKEYIILKYQKQLLDEEISENMKLSLQELYELNDNIIKSLKNNETLKKKIKKNE